ncbi:MAG: hypothetical protein QF486_00260 [Candidatus Woesearchaeota archaeon]|jgi:hypothetical protein|nr:hypothetical protein [Candidatus Woesearchaeota archaeon]MDP7198037.1 hypothetical protein [Candidatus Woesearchaeota archaeon]MDP7466871.1 hypothetical protein [Candidatus Woesearchaeota archaeon]MDP7647307.1 hypothetical protein [Candidatus Woesearchaeota archaeon]
MLNAEQREYHRAAAALVNQAEEAVQDLLENVGASGAPTSYARACQAVAANPDLELMARLKHQEHILESILRERGFTAVWLHLSEDKTAYMKVDLEEIRAALEVVQFSFEAGWNFYVITPFMSRDYKDGHFNLAIDEGHSVLKNDRIFVYEARRDSWEDASYTELLEEGEFADEDVLGLPFIGYFQYRFSPTFVENPVNEVPDFPQF